MQHQPNLTQKSIVQIQKSNHDASMRVESILFRSRVFSTPQIMQEIKEHKIKIYEFPETDDEEVENAILARF